MTAGDLVEALPEAIERDPRREGRAAIRELVSHGEAETAELARELAAGFRGGEVVLLTGELGAGQDRVRARPRPRAREPIPTRWRARRSCC